MAIPLILSFLAALAAAVMAYGVDPRWAEHPWGLGLIMLSRRLQWPLVALSLVLCIALLALVISGKRRAWWLIALLPVLALFGHRFLTAPANRYLVLDDPPMVSPDQAGTLKDDDHVVGVVFNGRPYAYPHSAVFRSPVIVQSDREKRMVLMWSAYANAATPLEVSREVKARDLDIVCDPRDSLLVYNGRSGQFIVGLTGETPAGEQPGGVEAMLPATTQTWRHWRTAHPDTRVLAAANGPSTVLLPRHVAPDAATPVVILHVAGSAALAVPSSRIATTPLNVKVGDVPVVLIRDRATGRVNAFDRRIEKDLIPQFHPPEGAKQRDKAVVMVDSDTGTGWDAAGVAIEGDKTFRGKKLAPFALREDVHLGPARFWYRGLKLHE